MPNDDGIIVLTCSVRHTFGYALLGRSRGQDTFRLPALAGRRVELLVDESLEPTAGARIEEDGPSVVVGWWFTAGSPLNYALVVHASASEAIDVDRFVELNSQSGSERELTFPRWGFHSAWR